MPAGESQSGSGNFTDVSQWLTGSGIVLKEGSLVDARTGLSRSLTTAAANELNLHQASTLPPGDE
ncbi:hypothetical protein [Endozoicomonas elysicola]|uniref:Uncharacterized protein n=2 Tax=Endozoicomonas elysicola TaxID=305900 RepID=A0A081KAS4_9GAMM|nr:hypothetical protein [Endozoicomonas elysicola]KEI71250.1 hypothetical protein GV64_11300 [Endozoicomonas elysicola]